MAELSPDEAVDRARSELGLDPAVQGRALRIRRLDRPEDAYYLVVFGGAQAATAVAAVGAAGGEVRNSARLPGLRPHLTVGAERARALAGLDAGARVEAVWRPCRASRSPLYPLWEVRTATGTVYVDQQGAIWRELASAGPGGRG